jgi:hypothetical protein
MIFPSTQHVVRTTLPLLSLPLEYLVRLRHTLDVLENGCSLGYI